MHAAPPLVIDGCPLRVEGADGPVLLMLHGWPDTAALWDGSVAALSDRFRCVRVSLPGYVRGEGRAPASLAAMSDWLRRVADAVSPGQPLTLVLHDWGCVFGYEFAARHADRVARIVAVDVGDHNSAALSRELSPRARRAVFGYQFWLALAWWMGGSIGDRMTRWMARRLRCPTLGPAVGCQMNYPYAMRWFGSLGGLAVAAPVDPVQPLLYVYGQRKPFMFHSRDWLARLAARPGCAAHGLPTGHWVMVQAPQDFARIVRGWLTGAA